MQKSFLIIGVTVVVMAFMPVTAAFAKPVSVMPIQIAASDTLLPFDNAEKYPGVNFESIKKTIEGKKGSEGVLAFIQDLFSKLKQLVGPILVFFIVGIGIQLVIARGEEESFNKAVQYFWYLLAGTAIVIFSQQLSDLFSLYKEGGTTTFVSNTGQMGKTQEKFTEIFTILVHFLRYLLGGIAVFYVVKSGLRIILTADEETVSKEKETFLYGFVGFILIMAADALVKVVFTTGALPTDGTNGIGEKYLEPTVNVTGGISLITSVTNLLLAAMSGLFLFTLVAGGAMYTFSAGNEERGKQGSKIIIGSLMGLIIAFASYTIVAEFSTSGGQSKQLQQLQKIEEKQKLELKGPDPEKLVSIKDLLRPEPEPIP